MFTKRIFYLFFFFSILGASVARASEVTFKMSDYGITPNSSEDTELCSRLEAALKKIQKEVVQGNVAVLSFEQGTYHFYSSDALCDEYFITNHDQEQPKKVGLLFENLSNYTLEGNGSAFVFHGRMIPLIVERSKNCTLRNFSIDFANPQIAQVTILSNTPEGITFRPSEEVKWQLNHHGRFETYGEDWEIKPETGIAFNPNTHHILYRTSDLEINLNHCHDLGDGMLMAPSWHDKKLLPGSIIALRNWERPCPGIFLFESGQTKIENVTVHYAEGMGVVAYRCTDIHLSKFSVCLKGENDTRCFTTQADATHFSQCKGKIVVEDGLFEGMMDDAINVHGIYLHVNRRLNDHTLHCSFQHEQAWGFAWGDPGDTVSFIHSKTLDEFPQKNIIESISPLHSEDTKGCKEFLITFRDTLPHLLNTHISWGVENLTWSPEVTFRNNVVRNNRARGALFSSPRHTVCENNLFDHTSGTAVLLCGDCNGWYESGAVRDLVVRNNVFINALTNMFQFTKAVISICPEIPDFEKQRTAFHGGEVGSILIENNRFETFDEPILYAKSTQGLVFRNNTLKKNHDFKPFHKNHSRILLENVRNPEIEALKEVE